jgi:hypothetical protein
VLELGLSQFTQISLYPAKLMIYCKRIRFADVSDKPQPKSMDETQMVLWPYGNARERCGNDELRSGIKSYSNWPTIPQLYVRGEFVGGCDIVREMFQAGELQSLLKDKGIPAKENTAA